MPLEFLEELYRDLADARFGFGGDDVGQFGSQNFFDRAVELYGLGDAHAMDFDSDDVKASAREEIDDVAGTARWKTEIVGLDQH